MPSFSFASLKGANISYYYWNPLPSLFLYLTKFIISLTRSEWLCKFTSRNLMIWRPLGTANYTLVQVICFSLLLFVLYYVSFPIFLFIAQFFALNFFLRVLIELSNVFDGLPSCRSEGAHLSHNLNVLGVLINTLWSDSLTGPYFFESMNAIEA